MRSQHAPSAASRSAGMARAGGRPPSTNRARYENRKLTVSELRSAPPYADPDVTTIPQRPEGGDLMLRKVLHLAYHFVTVADEVPRHMGHTN
jgi:hypothetical protein